MDWLVTQGHPPDTAIRYTLRQLRRVLDAIQTRLETQADALKRHR